MEPLRGSLAQRTQQACGLSLVARGERAKGAHDGEAIAKVHGPKGFFVQNGGYEPIFAAA